VKPAILPSRQKEVVWMKMRFAWLAAGVIAASSSSRRVLGYRYKYEPQMQTQNANVASPAPTITPTPDTSRSGYTEKQAAEERERAQTNAKKQLATRWTMPGFTPRSLCQADR
jgi:hypothetical protein